MTTNLQATIDSYGVLKAQIAELEIQAKAMKAELDSLDAGAYEGDMFRLSVSHTTRESPDEDLKAATAELVEKYLSRQYITAHTRHTPVTTLRVNARTGKKLAA